MEYYKLIALQIDDLSSSIFFESNFGIDNIDEANKIKVDLELKGYICVLLKTKSEITIR